MNRVLHVVRDHERGQIVARDDFLGNLKHLVRRLGVERRGVLVQQQKVGLLQRRHQKRQRLTLAAGQQADLAGHAVLEAKAERCELFPINLALLVGDAVAQAAPLAAAIGEREVFLDAHSGGSAHHRVLKHAAKEARALMLWQSGQTKAVEANEARIHRIHTRNQVERGGLARAVAADDRDEIAVFQRQVETVDRTLFVDRARVERLIDALQFKHCPRLPSHLRLLWRLPCPRP